jgi:glutaminyl-tRNA synthetase
MMVLNPIKVIINNLPTDYLSLIEKAIHPKNPSMGTNIVPFTSTIYIDADDFRTVASKEFFRLSPDGNVGLLNVPHPISYVSHETDSVGNVTLIVCRYEDSTTAIKPKAYIQWVAEHAPSNSPVRVDETRIFKRLFKSDDPAALEDFVKDIDPESLVKSSNALLEVGVWDLMKQSLLNSAKASEKRKQEAITSGTEAPPSVDGVESIRFQGTRVAYFAFDYDSKLAALEEGVNAKMERRSGDRLILNMIAPLKQDSGKKI